MRLAFGVSIEEIDKVIREYLSSSDLPGCPMCGEDLEVSMDYSSNRPCRIRLDCTHCRFQAGWSSPPPGMAWEQLHLAYFLECAKAGTIPRCPFDDCRVSHAEFEGGLIEFRCPYCGRRGRVDDDPSQTSMALNSNENESIVFLTV